MKKLNIEKIKIKKILDAAIAKIVEKNLHSKFSKEEKEELFFFLQDYAYKASDFEYCRNTLRRVRSRRKAV